MKKVCLAFTFLLTAVSLWAAPPDDDVAFDDSYSSFDSFSWDDDSLFGGSSSDDDLFGGSAWGFSSSDDDLFGGSYTGDESFFFDDGIEEWTPPTDRDAELSKGLLFEAGSIKIGGRVTTSLSTNTSLLVSNDDEKKFADRIADTTLGTGLNAQLSLDARPSQNLRMFMKGGLGLTSSGATYSMSDFSVDELFTDFSVQDRAFFRFGLHTVSWGTGYFFSPVSDIINTSSINPEDVDAQISGSINLRTQVTFPGTQNCLWMYLVPPMAPAGVSSNITDDQMEDILGNWTGVGQMPDYPGEGATDEEKEAWETARDEWWNKVLDAYAQSQTDAGSNPFTGSNSEIYAKHMGFAAKGEFVVGGWEIGVGGFYRYESAPKLMTTFTGSILNGKVAVFGETLLQYGSESEWISSKENEDKSLILQFTAGGIYMWKEPSITIAAQYYYDGNDDDFSHKYLTYGHNFAALVNFGNVFDIPDVNASLFGMINFGKKSIEEELGDSVSDSELLSRISSSIPQATVFANVSYSPVKSISFTAGPYISIPNFSSKPNINFRFSVSLGGGKF